mmetsp:Transcript_79392/g.125265  ORF Transcript_79392/g.125265 Transcript_79392/m.125265 type:complete len:226 (-) Transcript_79392:139-816(-)
MSNERVLESLKYTRMCKFITSGRCCRGSTCNFAHTPDQLKPMPDLVGTRLCAQFSATGRCRYGKVCKFAHGLGELKEVPVDTVNRPDAETASVASRFTEPPIFRNYVEVPRNMTISEPGEPLFGHSALASHVRIGRLPDAENYAATTAIENLRNTFWLTEGAIDSLLMDATAGSSEDSSQQAAMSGQMTQNKEPSKRSASTTASSSNTDFRQSAQVFSVHEPFWL